jgi:hypothetical protein
MPGSKILLETLIDADIFSEILRFILNLKVYLVHRCPTFDNSPTQMNPVLIFTIYLICILIISILTSVFPK